MKLSRIFVCLILLSGLSAGRNALANVVINEVAWMGTVNSANAEWIELYNNGPDAVTLDGWSLRAADGSPSVSLTGQLSAGGYFLLERTSDETVPGVTAGQTYSGSLGNTGEHLVLKNNLDETQDDVDATSGWPAGDNISKQSMSRSGASWITADPTPGMANHEVASTAQTPSPPSGASAAPAAEKEVEAADVQQVKADPKYSAKMSMPDFATAGTDVPFVVEVKQDGKRNMVDGRFNWYLGDGFGISYPRNTPFDHVFFYPGDYTVVMEYYSNVWKEDPDSVHKKKITIVPASISITGVTDDGGIMFSNKAPKDIDLAKWSVLSGTKKYIFPKHTIIPKGGTLSVSSHVIGFSVAAEDIARLTNPLGVTIATSEIQNDE